MNYSLSLLWFNSLVNSSFSSISHDIWLFYVSFSSLALVCIFSFSCSKSLVSTSLWWVMLSTSILADSRSLVLCVNCDSVYCNLRSIVNTSSLLFTKSSFSYLYIVSRLSNLLPLDSNMATWSHKPCSFFSLDMIYSRASLSEAYNEEIRLSVGSILGFSTTFFLTTVFAAISLMTLSQSFLSLVISRSCYLLIVSSSCVIRSFSLCSSSSYCLVRELILLWCCCSSSLILSFITQLCSFTLMVFLSFLLC